MYHFNETSNFHDSLNEINQLLALIPESEKSDTSSRNVILKSSVVLMISKFQVFVEGVLQELELMFKTAGKCNIPTHMILNSMRITFEEMNIVKRLENKHKYTDEFLVDISECIRNITEHCKPKVINSQIIKFNKKFPIGRTGKSDLLKLFEQFEGRSDIFAETEIDIEKIDGLLMNRHLIVHQDRLSSITEYYIEENIAYLEQIASSIDNYLNSLYDRTQREVEN